ncbi:MAG: BMP family ABC transporter substrate-binding protein [Clostridia bacterium]|nr:BMP family ABC transporter substrate-binding protein [Clostridia bacterium]
MKKHAISFPAILSLLIIASLLPGCSGKNEILTEEPTETTSPAASTEESPVLKIGMLTNGEQIDDNGINELVWDGLSRAGAEFGFEPIFIETEGADPSVLAEGIRTLADAGYKLIFCPGLAFSEPVAKAQNQYPDIRFVLIDAPLDAAANTAVIEFAVEQAGFVAAVASAVNFPGSEFGFIGGMETLAVKQYLLGFQQGLEYATGELGANASIKPGNIVYLGTFMDMEGGRKTASRMFGDGVDIIFTAAGMSGAGAFQEAVARRSGSSLAWVVGVDVDQYRYGVYNDNYSVVITSAVKKYDSASYEVVRMYANGTFPGGKTTVMGAGDGGAGIPGDNPNLSEAAVLAAHDAAEGIKNGLIIVRNSDD